MAVRNDLLIAPERPLRVAAPPRLPAPLPGVPWWSGRPAPHDRPDRPEGVERWRSDLVVAVPTSRRRRCGLVLLRPLAALPVLVLLVALRLAVLVALPVAWGCRVVANDLPQPLARAYTWTLRRVNRLRAWLWLTAEDPDDVALSLRRRPPHRRRRAWSWLLLAPFQLFLRYFADALAAVLVPLGWITSLVTGREPGAIERVLLPTLAWLARGDAYLLLLSDHRPRLPEIAPGPPSGAPDASYEPHQPRSGLRSRRRRSDLADDPGQCAHDRAPDRPAAAVAVRPRTPAGGAEPGLDGDRPCRPRARVRRSWSRPSRASGPGAQAG